MPAPTFVSSSGPNSFTTSTSALNYPATKADKDWYLLGIIYEGPASNVGSISGWGSKILTASGGGMFLDVYAKQSDGTESGSIGTISVADSTSSQAAVATYRSSTGVLLIGATSSGADTTSGTAYSATTGSLTTAADMLIAYIFGQNGVGTHSARTLTQAGATLGTLTNRFNAAGASVRQEFGDRPVTTGATAAIVHGCTLSVAATGLTGVILMSEGVAHTGTLDLSGSGTLSGAGTPEFTAALGLSGSGSTSQGGSPAIPSTAALSGSGAVALAGTPAMPGTAALSGAGQLTADGTPAVPATLTLAGTGSLTTAGQPSLPGDLPLSGGGTLAPTGTPHLPGTADLSGEGTLAGSAPFAADGTLALSGSGSLTPTGSPGWADSLDLVGTGALGLQGSPEVKANLHLSGSGQLSAAGVPTPHGALGLGGTSDLDLAGAAELPDIDPGLLIATADLSSALVAAVLTPVLTATDEPTSRLEATHGV